jgi:peroxiredoxin
MVGDVSFEAAAYSEGETQRFSFEGTGTTVLAFFPGAFTGVCTEEMCEFRDSMSEFQKLDAEVVGVSVDTPFALEEFAEQNNLDFTLVSDTGKEISEQYGLKTEMPGA